MYVKAELADGVEIKIKITHDNIFAVCPNCGEVVPIDLDEISAMDNWKKSGTEDTIVEATYLCDECAYAR